MNSFPTSYNSYLKKNGFPMGISTPDFIRLAPSEKIHLKKKWDAELEVFQKKPVKRP